MAEPSASAASSSRHSPSRAERMALVETLRAEGPDAATLCTGWTTSDLLAHLVARERRPSSGPGLLVPRFAAHSERVRTELRDGHSYDELLDQLAAGGPFWSPTANPLTDRIVNLIEFFVHHEDVRRAQPNFRPRVISRDVESILWSRLKTVGPLVVRKAPAGLMLVADGGRTVRLKRGEPNVRLSGQPSELLLFCLGRQSVARVQAEGDDTAVKALREASFSL